MSLFLSIPDKFKKFLKEHFESRPYYTEAYKIFEGYPHLSRILEKPITKKDVTVIDTFNKEIKGFAAVSALTKICMLSSNDLIFQWKIKLYFSVSRPH